MRPASAATRGPARPPRLLATLSALALAVTLASLYVHLKLSEAGGTYTSFCNVNARVNCDAVLTSPYSLLGGVPVEVWAALSYLGLIVLALVHRRPLAPAGIVALATWNLLFSLYMAGVATLVLRTVCLLCTLLYVLNLAIAVSAWPLLRVLRGGKADERRVTRRIALGGAATVVGAALVAAWHFTSAQAGPQPSDFLRRYRSLPVVEVDSQGRHARGPQGAAVTVVEFSDFECPHCARAHAELSRVLPRHAGTVRLVFRHYPLDTACNPFVSRTLHRNACRAAAAAECAGAQGRFWEYNDLLFTSQAPLGPETLQRLAAEVGLDRDAFARCLASDRPKAAIAADVRAAARAGVNSTPTFLFNGRKVAGALRAPLYEEVINYERAGREQAARRP